MLVVLAWRLAPASAPPAARQRVATPAIRALPAGRFEFTEEAREQLRAMWRASGSAKQERVACLGGYERDGVWYLAMIELLASSADSLGVTAGASLEQCGPPRWLGTIHTHVALRDGMNPYPTFSGADRGIMRLWSQRWGHAGVFCVVYSDHDAHCEVEGELVGGPETQATY